MRRSARFLLLALALALGFPTVALEGTAAAGRAPAVQGKKKPRSPRPAKPKKLKPAKKPKKNDPGFPL